MIVKKGSTDITTYVLLVDSAAGTPETGYTITNLDLQYTRNRTAPAAKVDAVALAATDTSHTDNRAIEVDGTSSPGLYRVDWPDAAFATGADKVQLVVTGSGLHPAVIEVTLVDGDLNAIYSDTTIVVSDTTAIHSDTTAVHSDTTAIHLQTTTIASDLVIIASDLLQVYSDTSIIYSDTTAIHSDTTAIHTQTTTIASDLLQVYSDTTIIASDLVQVYSDTTAIHSDTTAVHSDTTAIHLQTTTIASDLVIIASDLLQVYSDTTIIYSDTTAIEASGGGGPTAADIADAVWDEATSGHNSAGSFGARANTIASDLVQVYSDTTAIHSDTTAVHSDTTAIHLQTTTIASDLVIVASDLLQVYSDTTVIASDLVQVYSDTTAVHSDTTIIASDLVIVASDVVVIDGYLGSAAEPGQGAPPATTNRGVKIDWLYAAFRNKKTQTSTETKLYADDGSTVVAKSTVSDDATTFTSGEWATGA